MSTVSGACIVNKISGMCYIREDLTPSVLEWKAIEQPKTVSIPLNNLVNLQATKESSPKMILKVIYKMPNDETEHDIRLTFSNRPTMNNIKEALQTIVSRQRTVFTDSVKDGTPGVSTPGTSGSTPVPGGSNSLDSKMNMNFSSKDSLSDANLLKNHQLQQKLLMEDKNLRNLFTQAVINFKLSPNMFWSTRLNILRTFALTLSQHRGPYNVLSTIKPVATSDNQVNVNVTRTIINEIFDTYPIVKKAFDELVPAKFQEGEFWSRFFNSKLFRRLRGDKINNSNERGDMVLDKYLYVEADTNKNKTQGDEETVNKLIDLRSNESDNSVKLGNKPDFTMKFENDQNNEIIILMKNMNKLSSKMVYQLEIDTTRSEPQSSDLIKEYEGELNLHDLNPIEDFKFVDLKLNENFLNSTAKVDEFIDPVEVNQFLKTQLFKASDNGVNLNDIYSNEDIKSSYTELNNLIKLNHRTFRLINGSGSSDSNIVSVDTTDEIINLNLTINEFLSHFWQIFLNESNPNQLKKLCTNLKECKKRLVELKEQCIKQISENSVEKAKDKNLNDLNFILSPIFNSVDKALGDYVHAVRQSDVVGLNENGKRPLET